VQHAASNFSSRLQSLCIVLWVDRQAHVSPLSGDAMRRYPAGDGFPVPFGMPAFASCAFLCPLRDWPALAMG
jgi:hypothetical protein